MFEIRATRTAAQPRAYRKSPKTNSGNAGYFKKIETVNDTHFV